MNNPEVTRKHGEYLPHWTKENAIYNVCFRLADSLPVSVIDSYKLERDSIVQLVERQCREFTENELIKLQRLYSSKIEYNLNKGYGNCYLKRENVANIVVNAINFFNKKRYLLHTWCVMPNHVHIIVEPMKDYELFQIIHSWKSFSANEANKLLGLTGKFWHRDAYNHIIRSEKAYSFLVEYAYNNPDKAGLKDWKFRFKIVDKEEI